MGTWLATEGASSAAASLDENPRILAYSLARYQRAHCLDDQTVAAELGIPVTTLDAFRQCSLPWPDPYAVSLSRLAEAFGANVRVLSRMLAAGPR